MHEQSTQYRLAPLTLFSPSPTNPRRRIAQAQIEAMAESIAEHEVMQPVLARPKAAPREGEPPFELVAGHRRWEACSKLAVAGRSPHGDSIPALIRTLTDAQVLAMQLVENIHREDLHPLDEAEHYRRMREDAAAPASVEDIARMAKISDTRVYERLSLLQLVPAAREAFLAEKLSLKTALLVARMPAAHQAEATQHLANWGGEPMPPKAAGAFIRERFMLQLAKAPFDPKDAALLPTAGACGECPKRTGANPQLFGDISDADTCTDPTCFTAKKAAQRARLVDEVRVSGYTVLEGEQAREACTPDGRALKPGMHALDAQVPHALGDTQLKVAEVMQRASAPNQATRAIDHPGNPALVFAVPTGELEKALRKIKAHRQQLDKAAERVSSGSSPKPTPPQAAQASLGERGSQQAAAGEAAAGVPDATQAASQREALVAELLAFKPPATVAGKYGRFSAAEYQRSQEARALGILAAVAALDAMDADGAQGLPEHRLANMLCVLLWWGDGYLTLEEAARLLGLEPPAKNSSMESQLEWLWTLPDAQAERMAMVLLAAQEHDGKSVLQHFAPAVCQGLHVDIDKLRDAAWRFVCEQLQLGALANGKPVGGKTARKPAGKKPPAKKAPVKYRNAATGETWSGRGLQPKWLKAALEQGRTLAEFAAQPGAGQ